MRVCNSAALVRVGLWVVLSLVTACDKDEPQAVTTETEDAGSASKAAAVDPNLARAVAAASAGVPQGNAENPAADGGPPRSGIFAPGEADKERKPGEPAKLVLGSQGGNPKVELSGSHFEPGDKRRGTIQVALQTDPRQGALPIDLELQFDAKRAPAVAKATATKEGAAEAPSPVLVSARVLSATVAARPGSVPKQLADHVAQLKGSRVEYRVLPSGASQDFEFQLAKQAPAEFADVLQLLSDTLGAVSMPFPDKPVGTGAYWMVTERKGLLGIDTVSYHLVKVERVSGDEVTLNLNTKRYAADKDISLAGMDEKLSLEEFQSASEGLLRIKQGAPLPDSGQIDFNLAGALAGPANVQAPGGQALRQVLQVGGRAKLTFESEPKP